ncbi:MAG: hypothetical protein WC613_02425 [Candidatus Aenigmatarchaeota archaeon]
MNAKNICLNYTITKVGSPICFASSLVKNHSSVDWVHLEMVNTPVVLTSRILPLAIQNRRMQDFDGGYR